MNKRILIGFVASVVTAAGGTQWPHLSGIGLIALGVMTNGILISAMSSVFTQWEQQIFRLFGLVQEFEEMGREAKGFGVAAQRLRSVLRGDAQ